MDNIVKKYGGHARSRKYPGIKGRRPDRKEHRILSSAERLEEWQKRSPKEQLELLDVRLGNGVGAKKQRARLLAKLEAAKS